MSGRACSSFAALIAAAIFGCSLSQWESTDWMDEPAMSAETYQLTHSVPDNQWVGHSVDELIAERGEPDGIYHAIPMGSTFDHDVHVDSYVYGMYDNGPCVDAFVVVEETGQIVRYHCR
jgi:hypothetical protein